MRVRVATEPWLGLEQRDVVLAGEDVGRGEAGDTGADDRDLLTTARRAIRGQELAWA